MATGLFPIRNGKGGPRPAQPVNDARVATLLSEDIYELKRIMQEMAEHLPERSL